MLFNTRTYNADRTLPDSVAYAGPANTFTTVDKLELKRSYPKPQASFKGVAKPSAKLTKTVIVNATTGETANAILECHGSLPVGMTAADIESMLADYVSWLATADAKSLFKTLDINA